MIRIALVVLFLAGFCRAEDKVVVYFHVDPPDAEVYHLGDARSVQNGKLEFLGGAEQGWIGERNKLLRDNLEDSGETSLLFRAPGYRDRVLNFNIKNQLKNFNEVHIPSNKEPIVLEPLSKNYFAYALALAGVAAGVGGFLFLRGRSKKVEDIGSWVQRNMVPAAEEDPLLGKKMGDYWLLEKLGRGGMATVYRAVKDGELEGESYAVKVVHPHVTEGRDFKTRFKREVAVGDRLLHPNIVTLFQSGEIDGHYFIVLEFLDGGDLRGKIPEGGCSEAQALDYAIPIFQAVAFAHEKEIVHRDLKPENVLLSSNGRLKLSDFGLARSHQYTTVTETGSVMGTPGYIAPEQLLKGGPNPASDQYALGVILFELATGRLPFDGDEPMQILFKHIQEQPPAPSSLKHELSPQFDELVAKMLAKDPADRFTSVNSALAALETLKHSM